MLLCIDGLLARSDLAAIEALLPVVVWQKGASTAGALARMVKENRQGAPDCPAAAEIRRLVTAALNANPLFQSAARPARLSPVLVSAYEPGMAYGLHVDDALMAGLRADVSVTVFLSDPGSYDGGALLIDTPMGEQRLRLARGAAVIYPSTTLHQVEPVTRGVRHAAVLWVQSRIRCPAQRELLFDLDHARIGVAAAMPGSRESLLIAKTASNLLRLWAEG